MKNMNRSLFVLLCLLSCLNDVSCDGVNKTGNTLDVPAPKITRDYPPCAGSSSSKCLVVCSVSSVPQAQLSWFNGNVSLSNLTISNFNNKLFLEVEINDKSNYSCVLSSSGTNQTSYLNITHLCGPCSAKGSKISVTEGDSVTLNANLTKQVDIDWMYKENTLISKHTSQNATTYYGCEDGRFINKLQLDINTGSLTITNISKIHSGLYKLSIDGQHQGCQSYNITVDPLPAPVITNDSKQCPSSSKCGVKCSVNVRNVTLSWYKGNSSLSSISVSDLKHNFICLEVGYQDKNAYSCVVNNSVTRTTPLNIPELCRDESRSSIGIIFGVLIVVILLALVVMWCRRRQRYHGQL